MSFLAYVLMIPLSMIEGPIVALGAGAGWAAGKINPVVAGVILAFGAAFQDTLYYWLGRWAVASPRIRAFTVRFRLLRDTLQPLEAAWREALLPTLIGSKFAYGLYAPMLVTAGMAKAPFGRFLFLSLALSAGLLGAWFAAGYGLARAYGALAEARYATFLLRGAGVAGVVVAVLVARYVSRRLNPKLGAATKSAQT